MQHQQHRHQQTLVIPGAAVTPHVCLYVLAIAQIYEYLCCSSICGINGISVHMIVQHAIKCDMQLYACVCP